MLIEIQLDVPPHNSIDLDLDIFLVRWSTSQNDEQIFNLASVEEK
jgi:hypothetical protein